MAKALDNMSGLWRRMTLMQRVVLLAVCLAVVAAGALLVGWARKPQMGLLYAGLSAEEAGKIAEKIREEGTVYELKQEGTAIYVPVDKVAPLRLAMASAGLPAGDKAGYRILDEEKIGASPFAQRINYLRAIEGELAKTAQMIEGIVSARVHIVKPEGSVFAGKQKEGTATVVLRLKPGWRPTGANISAIVHMVAGSVEGLSPQKVVVVDSAGNLLNGENKGEISRKADTFLDYKSRVEGYLARKAEDMLATVLGPNRASVRVTAEIETTSSTQTVESYDPAKRVITKEEIRSSSGAAAGGGAAGPGGKEENTVTEYQVSRTVEQREDLPGKIKSLSVAAFVSLNRPQGKGEKSSGPAITEKDAEEMIRNAVGLRAADTLKVVNTAFYEQPAPEAKEEAQGFWNAEFLLEMARRFSLGILVIGALVVLRLLRGSRKGLARAEAGANLPVLEGQGQPNLLTADQADPEALRMQITHALMEKPEEVKRLFVSWAQSEEQRT